jgi:hypothetical protein
VSSDKADIAKMIKRFNRRNSVICAIMVGLLILILASPYLVNSFNYNLSESEVKLRDIIIELTEDSTDDEDKSLALLKWFDRGVEKQENLANTYYRGNQEDNIVLLNVGNILFIYSKPPHFCTRLPDSTPNWNMWIFSTRCGMCGEYATLFSTMANYANLTVRKVCCEGEDHIWNEILVEGEWIVVDSTAVALPRSTGFDLPRNFMEDKVKGDLWNDGNMVDEGNVSYVYAIYPNAPDDRVDITYRYTNLTNISVLTIDADSQPIEGVSVKVYSYNRYKGIYTGLVNTTNEVGQHIFVIGGGDYTFKAEKGSLQGELRGSFKEGQSYNVTIVIK